MIKPDKICPIAQTLIDHIINEERYNLWPDKEQSLSYFCPIICATDNEETFKGMLDIGFIEIKISKKQYKYLLDIKETQEEPTDG